MKRYSFLLALAAMLVLSFGLANGQNAIYVSSVNTGYSGPDTVATGKVITWTIAMRAAEDIKGLQNGFIIHDDGTGSGWALPVLDTLDIQPTTGLGWKTRWDNFITVYHGPFNNGSGTDTVGIVAVNIGGDGWKTGFDFPVLTITIPNIHPSHSGKRICLDSSGFDVNSEWLWLANDVKPDWDGPHCYDIFTCCNGNRGDLNGDGVDANILDLTFAVDRIFRGGAASVCPEEADVNADGTPHNILDLTFLVDRIFRGGGPPGGC